MDLNPSAVKTLLDAGTAVISDVFDAAGLDPMTLDTNLASLDLPPAPFAGPAYTIGGESFRWRDGAGDRVKLAAIDAMVPGSVAVWAGGDIKGVCCFGDLLSEAMKARGCAGVVVDGGVRDVAHIRSLGLNVRARYRTPSQSIGRWHVTSVGEPVRVRGAVLDWVDVAPGDLIVADEDGVIVVPESLVESFAEKAKVWAEKDGQARQDIQQGAKLIDTLNKYGHL